VTNDEGMSKLEGRMVIREVVGRMFWALGIRTSFVIEHWSFDIGNEGAVCGLAEQGLNILHEVIGVHIPLLAVVQVLDDDFGILAAEDEGGA
jgi:hypothetical protein